MHSFKSHEFYGSWRLYFDNCLNDTVIIPKDNFYFTKYVIGCTKVFYFIRLSTLNKLDEIILPTVSILGPLRFQNLIQNNSKKINICSF